MKLEVFQECPPKSTVYLRLTQDESGAVVLQAVDRDGKRVRDGNILTLCPDGTIVRHVGVARELEFSLDDAGRVVFR